MTRPMLAAVLALALLAFGCGRTGGGGTANDVPPAPDSAFGLRIAGDDAGDFLSARMRIKSVRVTSGGTVLADDLRTPEMELTAPDSSYLLTRFQPAAGTEDVEFEVAFESGTVVTANGSQALEAACEVIRLPAKVSQIAQRKHAVIHLDLSRSLMPSTGGWALVPHFRLMY